MPTRYEGGEAETRALDAYIKLLRAAGSVDASLHPLLAEARLTGSQFGVLEALLHLGPLNQCDLGRKLLMSGGNVTMIVDNLERRELVRRVRDTGDRRFIAVHLTDEGRELITGLFPRHVENLVRRFAILTAEEQLELARLCKKLGRNTADEMA